MESSSVGKLLSIVAIGYTCALTIGSLIKPVQIDTSISNIDKLLHTGAYFGLALLWLSYIHLLKTSVERKWAQTRVYVITALILVIYGIVIELLQGSLTSYRTPDVWDVLANSIGVLLGSLLFVLFFKKFNGLKS